MPKKIKQLVKASDEDKIKLAEKVIKDAQEKKMKKCFEEIETVMKKHGFVFDIRYQMVLVPRPPEQQRGKK
jgi:ribosomal protein S8